MPIHSLTWLASSYHHGGLAAMQAFGNLSAMVDTQDLDEEQAGSLQQLQDRCGAVQAVEAAAGLCSQPCGPCQDRRFQYVQKNMAYVAQHPFASCLQIWQAPV
jgi:hypothetical protein